MGDHVTTPDHRAILADFGKTIGIPQIEFDAQGHCCLGFDEVVLNIEYNADLKHFLIYSALGPLPPVPDVSLMERLLDLNYASLIMGKGAIGVDRDARAIIFVERIALRGLTSKDFEDAIQSIVNRVEALKEQVAAQGGRAPDLALPGDGPMLRA
jgi:Tir chaperone protein (CesT) family